MKKILLIGIAILTQLHAQNLSQILESLESSHKVQAILKKSESEIAQSNFYDTYEAPSFGMSVSHADSIASDGEDGLEYSFGISQEISEPFSSSKAEVVSQNNKAIRQVTKHELHLHRLDIVLSYHTACVSQEMQDKSSLLYEKQKKRYVKVKKAYELGEISKKDLLFNKLDLAKLQQNINLYKREYLEDFSSLQELLDTMQLDTLSCNDLVIPHKSVKLNSLEKHGEIKVLKYKKNASLAEYNVNSASVTAIGYELLYEKELDTKRYTLGLSIPLGGLSGQKEQLKVQQFALNSSYTYEQDSMKVEIQNYSKLAIAKLEVLYDELQMLNEEILPLNEELVTLAKLALLEGEGDIMEYLDATRSYSLHLLEMLKIKKFYYKELFTLYKIADLDYGEKK